MNLIEPILLGVHLLIVGAASAAPLYCLWLEWTEAKGNELAGRAGRYLAGASFILLWLGALLGLVLGWLAWTPEWRDALLRLGSRLHSAGGEWLFSVILIGFHWWWWKRSPQPRTWVRALRSLLPLLAGTNLLYHFPMLFYVLERLISEKLAANLAENSEAAAKITGAEFRRHMMATPTIAKALHFWLASFVSAGLLLIWHARRDVNSDRRAIAWGARGALVAAFLQLPVGLWLTMLLPSASQRTLMGGDMLATGLFVVGVFTALGLMHFLGSLAFGKAVKASDQDLRRASATAIALGIVVVLLMSAAAHLSRPSQPAATSPVDRAASADSRPAR